VVPRVCEVSRCLTCSLTSALRTERDQEVHLKHVGMIEGSHGIRNKLFEGDELYYGSKSQGYVRKVGVVVVDRCPGEYQDRYGKGQRRKKPFQSSPGLLGSKIKSGICHKGC
jgi:hypothetical protein